MFSESSSSLFPKGPRRVIGLIVLVLFAGDAWLAAKFWPNLSVPTLSKSTPTLTAAATRPQSPPNVVVHRSSAGAWTLIGKGVEMIAQPAKGDTFVCRVIYTTAAPNLLGQWQTIRRLRTLLTASSRNTRGGPPMGLTRDQIASLRPLLANFEVQLSDAARAALQTEMASLSAKCGAKPVNSPVLLPDERKLVADLNAVAAADIAAGQPALRDRISQIQQIMGMPRWQALAAARVAPGGLIANRTSRPSTQRTYGN